LDKVSKHSQAAGSLVMATKVGLLTKKGEGILSFRHDSIHTAAYSLIPDNEKSIVALTLGRRLWRRAGEKGINKYTADIVGLLYRGRDVLTRTSSSSDIASVASLCLQASKLAAKSAGFHSSIFFVDFGIELLEHAGKWKDNYDLCLSLHNNAVDVHYGVGQFDKVEELVDEVLENARCFEDTIQARMMKVYTLGTKKQLVEALEYGVETLTLLGDPIPAFPTYVQVWLAVARTKRRLKKKSDAALLRIPTLADKQKIEVMMALQILFLNAYFARPSLAVLISCRIIDITLKHGACAVSSVGFAGYSVVVAR
jgi:histidine kinase